MWINSTHHTIKQKQETIQQYQYQHFILSACFGTLIVLCKVQFLKIDDIN